MVAITAEAAAAAATEAAASAAQPQPESPPAAALQPSPPPPQAGEAERRGGGACACAGAGSRLPTLRNRHFFCFPNEAMDVVSAFEVTAVLLFGGAGKGRLRRLFFPGRVRT